MSKKGNYVILLTFFCFLFLISASGWADTHLVTKAGTDSGDCTASACLTISYAVGQASSGDTVSIGAGTFNESVTFGSKTLTFAGAGTTSTIWDGGGTIRPLNISAALSNITITITDITFQNGTNAGTGGCITMVADPGGLEGESQIDMTLQRVAIKDCTAGQIGGGIYFGAGNGGTLTMDEVSISGCTAQRGGGITIPSSANGTQILNNVTFYDNTATGGMADGGAILAAASATLKNCTLADNSAGTGGGIKQVSGTVTVINTIIDNSTGNNCSGTITDGGNNISSDSTCSGFTQDDPLLGDFEDNGGPVYTMSLLEDSPAIDAGSNANCTATDARGETRPADGDGDETATCDIGAYEIVCGDSVVDADEECDDGNSTDTDACTNACEDATCGDGIVRSGVEECDNGNSNSDSLADACRTDCTNATCGDGVKDSDEGCDDGNSTNTDSCLNTCASATCGDGVVQADSDEECDEGNGNSNSTADACRTTCVEPSCGDGVVDTDEECDDDNSSNADSCLSSCVSASCGDGIVETDQEECDEGDENSDEEPDACRSTCVAAACGDGIIDTGETCDDENTDTEDGCSQTCVYETYSDLTTKNPLVNFLELTTNQTISFESPIPGASTSSLRAQPQLLTNSSCSCSWTLTPETFGTMEDTEACSNSLTVTGTTQANLAVAVDCGTSSQNYNQTLIVAAESSSSTSSSSGGGCSLQDVHQKTMVFYLLGGLLVVLGSVRYWRIS